MSKTITISIETLNSLYCKFLNKYVLQYLPKNLFNDVSTLITMKSPIEAFKQLDKMLNNSEYRLSSEGTGEKSNLSNQGSTAYIEKDEFNFLRHSETDKSKKPPAQLKRTQTYVYPQTEEKSQ